MAGRIVWGEAAQPVSDQWQFDDWGIDAPTDTELDTGQDTGQETGHNASRNSDVESNPASDQTVTEAITAPPASPETAAPPAFGTAFERPAPTPHILLPPVNSDDATGDTTGAAPTGIASTGAAPHKGPISGSGHWYSLTGASPLEGAAPEPDAASHGAIALARRRGQRQTTRDRVRQRKLRRQRGIPDDWASMVIISALVGVTTVIGIAIFFIFRAATVTGTITATSIPQQPTSIFYGAAGGALGADSLVINPWSGSERFTVLVMGKDKRPGEFGSAFLTDTMILISLDPQSKRVGILSLPRDLQVEIPEGDYGVQPINTAYRLGELDGPGGGPRLAMITVQYNFGISVNDYLVVDFETFIRIIDEVGGINVEVKATIDDPEYPDMNYGYDPFYLEAGWHLLDGHTALKFARSRHQSDDIDRAYRQQQVLYALRDKVISANMLPELAGKAYPLYADLKGGIDTSLSLDQMLELAWYVKDIERHNIVSDVVGWDYIIAENWNGRPIIRPNREKLPSLLAQVFGPNYDQ